MNLIKFSQLDSIRKLIYGLLLRYQRETFNFVEKLVAGYRGEIVLDGYSGNPDIIFEDRGSFFQRPVSMEPEIIVVPSSIDKSG
jgi:hypothetical protein